MVRSRRGSNLPCLAGFGFPDFVSCIGVWMACLRRFLSTVFGTRMCSSTGFGLHVLCDISDLVGDRVFPI